MRIEDANVLIVDDSNSFRIMLIEILKQMGFRNIADTNLPTRALEMAIEQSRFSHVYDIIFLDINMPVIDGITVLRRLRQVETYKNSKIIMVSTEKEKDVIVNCLINGANDYILKPFDSETIIKKVKAALS